MRVVAVVPSYQGRALLGPCLEAIAAQTRPFDAVVVADDASTDGTAGWLADAWPDVQVVRRDVNGGFAAAANTGVQAAHEAAWVALVNSDVVLAADWLEQALVPAAAPDCAAVATKLVTPDGHIDDTGDTLRRDGVCEQRGRGRVDDGRFDAPGPVWGACAGAALYRRAAFLEAGGFEPLYRQYLEDVDLALRLRLAGWTCAYVPACAVHAGAASSALLTRPVGHWTARNTLLLAARWFPLRWAGFVVYRQLSWLLAAARGGPGALASHLGGLAAGLALVPGALRSRAALRRGAVVTVADAVPERPWRGPRAGGHPEATE